MGYKKRFSFNLLCLCFAVFPMCYSCQYAKSTRSNGAHPEWGNADWYPKKMQNSSPKQNRRSAGSSYWNGSNDGEATQIDISEVNDQVIQTEPVAPREPEGAYESCFATLFCPIHHEQDLTFKRNKNLKDIFIVLPTTVICLASKIIF